MSSAIERVIDPPGSYRGLNIDAGSTPHLYQWWIKWINPRAYPDSVPLLLELYPGRQMPETNTLRVVLRLLRESHKPIPLLWDDLVQVVLPFYYKRTALLVQQRRAQLGLV
jgi:hypothetical protein